MFMRELQKKVISGRNQAVVEVEGGKLRGVICEDTYIFRGIKYADSKRFCSPQKVQPWTGTKTAFTFGYAALELNTPLAHDTSYVPHYLWPQNENCQYLNIWTQSIDRNAKKPVMVWLHGGGWFAGSGMELFSYDGEELSRFGDVVVVTLNHRLGALAFWDLREYGEQYSESLNAGLWDLKAALQWIDDNIEAFGGNPQNVTIMGQSGGGEKVIALMQTPAADGLYHRAITQSGGSMERSNPRDSSRDITERTLRYLNIEKNNIEKLETIPYYEFARAVSNALYEWRMDNQGKRFFWGPTEDGVSYLGHPLKYGFRKESSQIPMMVGSVLGEFSGNADIHLYEGCKNDWNSEIVKALYEDCFGKYAQEISAEFSKAYPQKRKVDALFVDKEVRLQVLRFVQERKKAGSIVYNWLFTLETLWNGGTVAWHNSEEPYMFHNARYIESAYIPGVSERLQDQMAGAWVEFAKNGNPNHSGLPKWDPVLPHQMNTMIFDEECVQVCNHDEKLLDLLKKCDEEKRTCKKIFPGSNNMHAIYGALY